MCLFYELIYLHELSSKFFFDLNSHGWCDIYLNLLNTKKKIYIIRKQDEGYDCSKIKYLNLQKLVLILKYFMSHN